MAVKRFCYRWNLRTGSLVCAVWTLIWCAFSMAMPLYSIYEAESYDYYDYNYDFLTSTEIYLGGAHNRVSSIVHWCQGGVALIAMMSAILLIIGILRNKAALMIMWMVMVVLLLCANIVSLIFNMVSDGLSKLITAFLLIWIITALINLYSGCIVYAHYKEVKSGRGLPQHYRNESESEAVATASVRRIHMTDGTDSRSLLYSQRTVNSFQSQTLYEDEKFSLSSQQNLGLRRKPSTASNGRILLLRPVTSTQGDDSRFGANAYTGSIEMKIVNSVPVISKQPASYVGSTEMHPGAGRRPKRFRTVSESAANRPPISEVRPSNRSIVNSMKNIAGGQTTNPVLETALGRSVYSRDKPNTPTFMLGSGSQLAKDPELSPLTNNEQDEDNA